jgi:dipeptidyl aminopeptidase/acylaminoacyl peptidase
MEKYFEVKRDGFTLRGTLHIPDAGNGPFPALVFCHGFTANMSGPHRMFVKAARELEKLGVVSARFDCMGSGGSDGDFSEMTLTGEAEDCAAVFKYLSALDFVDSSRIALLGHSMGSPAVITANLMLGGAVWKNLLLGTAATLYHELIAPLTGAKLSKFMAEGTLDFGGFTIGKALIDDICERNYFSDALKMSGRTLLVHGAEDGESPVYNSVKLKELLGGKAELRLIDGSDHSFSSPTFERQAIDEIIHFMTEN